MDFSPVTHGPHEVASGRASTSSEANKCAPLALPRLIIGDRSAVLHSQLGQSGYFEVAAVASDAVSLIDLISDHQPDITLVDVLLSGNGLRATESIGRVAPDTAIVVHSADEHRATILEFLRAGAIYHVRSGTDAADLVHLLQRAMDAHRIWCGADGV
jgi:DNA-binding NarL/FixJ family response regulator